MSENKILKVIKLEMACKLDGYSKDHGSYVLVTQRSTIKDQRSII